VEKAQQISGKRPVYPAIAQSAHMEGSVRIQFVVAIDGTTKDTLYLSGPPILMKAAIDAIRTWRFNPTLVAGAPAEVQTIATVDFYLSGHDPAKQLAPYRKAVEKNPNDPKPHVALGRQMLIVGQIDDAVGEFRQAISIQPDDASAHFGLGDALGAQGDRESAIKEYQQGLSLNPADADAHFRLAILLEQKGDLEAASKEYQKACKQDPANLQFKAGCNRLAASPKT
jgi:TonB family protein